MRLTPGGPGTCSSRPCGLGLTYPSSWGYPNEVSDFEAKIPCPKSNVLPPKRHVHAPRLSQYPDSSVLIPLQAVCAECVKNFCFLLTRLSRPSLSPGDALLNYAFPHSRPQNCSIRLSELQQIFRRLSQSPPIESQRPWRRQWLLLSCLPAEDPISTQHL